MPITLFSELKVRLSESGSGGGSGASGSGQTGAGLNMTTIDPEVGFKINWDRVGESAAAAAATGAGATTTSLSSPTSSPAAAPSAPQDVMPSPAHSLASMGVLNEVTMLD